MIPLPPATSPSSSRRFDALAEALAVAVLTTDRSGMVDYANPAARELFWRAQPDLLGSGWLAGIDAVDRERVDAATSSLQRAGDVAEVEFRLDVAGFLRRVRGRMSAVGRAQPGTGIDGWVGVFDDVTTERETVDDLSHRADHDALTGLPNRAVLADRVDQAVARCGRSGEPMAVFFLDLDHFKPVNDLHGHVSGDQVLRAVATRLGQEIRSTDTLARRGGDEFVVVTEGLDREAAAQVAHRLVDAVRRPIAVPSGLEVRLSASVGIAWGRPGTATAEELIGRADRAMYEAKRTNAGVAFAADIEDVESGEEPRAPHS